MLYLYDTNETNDISPLGFPFRGGPFVVFVLQTPLYPWDSDGSPQSCPDERDSPPDLI